MNIDSVWQGCKHADRKAQQQLYQYFSPKMFAVCLRYAKDYAEAEDILQTGFVKVFTKHELYDGRGSLEGWIRRIMVNVAIEHFRKHKMQFVDVDHEADTLTSSLQADQSHYQDLMQLINQLPVGYKTIFNLYAIEGYSHKEIASMLQISEGNSKSQLSRARDWLKVRIIKEENLGS